jgi:formylglycine-generating enzyme required for sulfatase activity/uncharacterized caspase-like protein
MTKRIALLIGVSEYGAEIPPLLAAPRDVAAMQQVLADPSRGNFEVWEPLINPDLAQFQIAVQRLFTTLKKSDVGLLFFSGHGLVDDNNHLYLATKGTSKAYYKATSVPANFIQGLSKESYSKRQIIILDCCYSGAFAEGWKLKSVGLDLQQELGAEGRVVLTSSNKTQLSFQQEDGDVSLYTQYLVEGLKTGAAANGDGRIYAQELHQYVKNKVQEVKPAMEPDIICDGEGFNILISLAPVNDPSLEFTKLVENSVRNGEISRYRRDILKKRQAELTLTDAEVETIINRVLEPFIRRSANLEEYRIAYQEEVTKSYPLEDSLAQELRDWGQECLGLTPEDITKIESEITTLITPFQSKVRRDETPNIITFPKENNRQQKQAEFFTEDLSNGITLEMVKIPAGSFLMGTEEAEVIRLCKEYETDWFKCEMPQHRVNLQEFYLGKYSVTQEQYQAIMGNNPLRFKDNPKNPVESVSWDNAQEFCQKLNEKTGKKYRLPSEAEWEYACRAGTTTSFYFGETISTDQANYDGNYTFGKGKKGVYREKTTPVGSFPANKFGLYDLHGNVWEWCQDVWHENYENVPKDGSSWDENSSQTNVRSLRGGSWSFGPRNCRSAGRDWYYADFCDYDIGFRLAVSFF